MNCSSCGKALGQQYLRIGQLRLHPNCFRCAHCQQVLPQQYVKHKGYCYHSDCYKQKFALYCDHCKQALDDQWVTFEKKKLHAACYQAHYQERCVHCQQLITGSYHRDETGAWHVACYDAVKLEPCDICQEPLKGSILLDKWGHKAHRNHGGYPTRICSVCSRFISARTSQNGVQYGDGRVVCGICHMSEVSETHDITHAKKTVIAHLQAVGFDYIPDYINVSLADQKLLNQRLGVHSGANSFGYTKTLEKRLTLESGQQISREHSIFILFGLPRLVFHGVLAHELLHVWLNDRGLRDWSEKEVEGFCNLGSALIYQQDNSPLAKLLLKQLNEDRSAVYGEGYRLMSGRLQKLGWPGLITEMQKAPTGIRKLNKWIDKWI